MIRIAGNTDDGTIYVIETIKGFTVYALENEGVELLEWLAVKNDLKFSATSPQELLGLITMYEHLGDKRREYSDRKFTDEVFEREYKDEN